MAESEVKMKKLPKTNSPELDIVGYDCDNVYWGDNSTTRVGSAEYGARLAKRWEFLRGQQ